MLNHQQELNSELSEALSMLEKALKSANPRMRHLLAT